MKLVLIFGPQAVGKMTVGQELEKRTGMKLFHNHMTIDLLHPYFGFTEEMWRLNGKFREEIFKTAAKSELEGLIFTYVWAFDQEGDGEFVEKTKTIFETAGVPVYFVELEADMDERLKRNLTDNRLVHKPTKRNTEESETHLRMTMEKHRLNSHPGEVTYPLYVRINNTDLTPEETAERIRKVFGF